MAQGAEGQALINQIASYTHAVVFASTDATGGNSSDWTLEYSSQPGATIVPLISADAISPSDSVLIFSGYPPIDNLATCYQVLQRTRFLGSEVSANAIFLHGSVDFHPYCPDSRNDRYADNSPGVKPWTGRIRGLLA